MVERQRMMHLGSQHWPTPQQVLDLFDALPDEFAKQANIPSEEIKELAQSHTVESIDHKTFHKLRKWHECVFLYLDV